MQSRFCLFLFSALLSLSALPLMTVGCSDSGSSDPTGTNFQGCTPNTLFCNQNAVVLCDPDGQGFTLTTICEANHYCDSGMCIEGTAPIPVEGGDTEGGNPEGGNPEGGNPEGGNPEGGNPEGGNPEGGNPEGGDPEGGNPEGGDPEGGNPEGGNPEGGDPEGGDPEGGDPEGGDPGSPVASNCLDGQFTETLPNPNADISSDIAAYSASDPLAFIQSVLGKRFPLGLAILNGGLQSDIFEGPNCVDNFLSNTSSAQAVTQQLSTLVHECGHYYDLDIGGFFDNAYFVNESLTIVCQGGGGPSNGGQTFPRSLIKNDEYAALHTPCENWNDTGCDDTYAGIYLNGDPNDGNFDSGDQGFSMLFEETLQYVNSLATDYAFNDAVGGSISARDGILTFLWYTERYLRMARLEHPGAYTLLSENACWREAILKVWGRAWLYLNLTESMPKLGIKDQKLMGLVMDPDLLNEIELLRQKQNCP